MNKNKLKRFNFGSEKFEEIISNFYSELYNKELHKQKHISNTTEPNFLKNGFFLIEEIPNYLITKENKSDASIKYKMINTYSGSLINLVNFNTLDEYLKNAISKQRKNNIVRRQRRLDLCIQPTYKMYYGFIEKDEYETIFRDYKQMLLRRLKEKEAYWEELEYWEERYKTSYARILNKEACVYVIYHKEAPIGIYICSVFDTTILAEVIAYDIDYSKFHLGYITLIKLIEWGILNNYELIDLSKGDFDYKKSFRNGTYVFQNHLIYDSRNLQIFVKAKLLGLKMDLLYKLLPKIKQMKIYHLYKENKRLKKQNLFKNINSQQKSICTENNYKIDSLDILKKVSLKEDNYLFLKNDLIDFIFLGMEYYDDVLVYKIENKKNTYIFKGKKSTLKIVYDL